MAVQTSEIVSRLRNFEFGRVLLPPPATEAELVDLQQRSVARFGTSLPDEYIEFLALVNGFTISSLTFAGAGRHPVLRSDGTLYCDLVIPDVVAHADAMLVDYEPNLDGLVVLSYSSPLYGWCPSEGLWVRAFYDSGIVGHYGSFEELLVDALQTTNVDVSSNLSTG